MRKSPIVALFVCLLSVLAPAQDSSSKPLTRDDLQEMLETLEKMGSKMRSKYHGRYREAVKSFQAAAATPITAYEFYLKCQKKTRFDDQGKLASAFKAWKDSQESTHEDIYFRQALQMQLKYLILSLKAGLAETDEDYRNLIPFIVSYLDEASKADGRAHRWLNTSTSGTIFAETYELDRILVLPDWESNPMEIGSVFESSILPYYREEQRDPRLVSAWKSRLDLTTEVMKQRKEATDRRTRERQREARRRGRADRVDPRRTADNSIRTETYEEFLEEELPELKWKMGKDLLEHGFDREALSGLLGVLRDNETHPSTVEWIGELTELLKERLGLNKSAAGVDSAARETGRSGVAE